MNEKNCEKKLELTKVESEWQRKYIAPRLTSCARKGTMRHSESNSPKLQLKFLSLQNLMKKREDGFSHSR
jgi:hypothetical protein